MERYKSITFLGLIWFYVCAAIFVIFAIALPFLSSPFLVLVALYAFFFKSDLSLVLTYFEATTSIAALATIVVSVPIFMGIKEHYLLNKHLEVNKVTKRDPQKSMMELFEDLGRVTTFSECMALYSQSPESSDLEYLTLERALELATTKEQCWVVSHHAAGLPKIVSAAAKRFIELKNIGK